jgi:hypothetical protein
MNLDTVCSRSHSVLMAVADPWRSQFVRISSRMMPEIRGFDERAPATLPRRREKTSGRKIWRSTRPLGSKVQMPMSRSEIDFTVW